MSVTKAYSATQPGYGWWAHGYEFPTRENARKYDRWVRLGYPSPIEIGVALSAGGEQNAAEVRRYLRARSPA